MNARGLEYEGPKPGHAKQKSDQPQNTELKRYLKDLKKPKRVKLGEPAPLETSANVLTANAPSRTEQRIAQATDSAGGGDEDEEEADGGGDGSESITM